MNTLLDESGAPLPVSMRRSITAEWPTTPAFPATLKLRHARIEESDQLAMVLGRAYPTEIWEPSATKEELFKDESVKAVLVVAQDEQLLATASLQIHSDNPKAAQIRWVATEKNHRREGLAQALVIELLLTAAKDGCAEVWLKTTTDLMGAIALYKKLGFEPIVSGDADQKLWTRLLSEV